MVHSVARRRSELLLPSPTVTLARLWELALKGSFWLAVLQSLLRIIAGCALGIAAGSILGVLTAMSRVLYELFTPLLTVVRSTPSPRSLSSPSCG